MQRIKNVATLIIIILALFLIRDNVEGRNYSIQKAGTAKTDEGKWNSFMAGNINTSRISFEVNGQQIYSVNGAYMSENLEVMIPAQYAGTVFDCAANLYAGNLLHLERNTDSVELSRSYNEFVKGGLYDKDGKLYVSALEVCHALNLNYEFDMEKNKLTISTKNLSVKALPYKYDLRDRLRAPMVKNQGSLGSCWAFAALSSLESALLPNDSSLYSVDHMLYNNSFNYDINSGGGYTMGMAYLLAWQGPVLEKDDRYGDGKTDKTLKPVKHVQEIQLLKENDIEVIKRAIYKYGAVQASFYNSLPNAFAASPHFNKETNAYCYIGTNKANHEIIIVGWDDNYSKENFLNPPMGNGAFICQNSWGTEFGDDGYFYVSYYDSNIGLHTLAYTSVEDTDNYDSIYQTDLCGWVGQIGFNNPTAYAMNVYNAKSNESLEAVGVYATAEDTQYKVYVVRNFDSVSNVRASSAIEVASGTLGNAGYYTLPIERVKLEAGKKFAVIVKLTVPNAVHPIAIECGGTTLAEKVDLTDGEGYISSNGIEWISSEKEYECNICLKAYTRKE